MRKLSVVTTRVSMLEGTCCQRPYQLCRDSSLVLQDTADLDLMISHLNPSEVDAAGVRTYQLQVGELRETTTIYFKAADKRDFDINPPPPFSQPAPVANDPFKLRKCAPPVFSGEPRDFPRW